MKKDENNIIIIGHRGASVISPPNTLKAFKKAIELKADYVEFDIHITKDSEIVIIHDSDTFDITGVKGVIKDMTLEQIKSIDAGEGEKIPTLQELINIAGKKMGLQIEIKATNLLEKLIQILKEENLLDTSIVSSFMFDEVLKLKLLEPVLKVGLLLPVELEQPNLIKRKIKKVAKNNFYSLHPHYSITDKEIVNFAHEYGLKVIVWTVNDRKIMENLMEIGVDGIITDDISLANDVFGRLI
ncbi:MAG: glycerophosphodiester phosphodiesterase [Candidatus Lokiarchaeota archaeon]|nr:glycerophosphodiester phosphodiesterase [Candidatus Lokiarchaeota archaeon]